MFSDIDFILIDLENKKNQKNLVFFLFLGKKKTINRVSKFGRGLKKGLVQGKYWNKWCPLRESVAIKCTNLFLEFQRGTLTQKDKKTSPKQKYQNLAFFYPLWDMKKFNVWLVSLDLAQICPLHIGTSIQNFRQIAWSVWP